MKKFSDLAISNVDPQFKGWTKPGPSPDLVRAQSLSLESDETLDGFCGHFRIAQLKNGHRFSTDDLLCAWYATAFAPSPSRILDLGSGLGTVAMAMAWRLNGAEITTVEAQERSVCAAAKIGELQRTR